MRIAELKKAPIGELRKDFYLIRSVQQKTAKNGNPYLVVGISDRTGSIEAKFWEPREVPPNTGEVWLITLQVGEYRGKLDFTIRSMRPAIDSDYVPMEELKERAPRSSEDMFYDIVCLVESCGDSPVVLMTLDMLNQYRPQLLDAAAATKNHHAYLGGLLEHILSLLKSAMWMSDHYGLRKDLMAAACVLHDIGKLEELQVNPTLEYTPDGRLVGHIIMGSLMLQQQFMLRIHGENVSQEDRMLLFHLIASHHGTKEWGSPVLPATREAIVFHFLDMIDSRIGALDAALKHVAPSECSTFTEYVPALGTRPYIHGCSRKPGEQAVEEGNQENREEADPGSGMSALRPEAIPDRTAQHGG